MSTDVLQSILALSVMAFIGWCYKSKESTNPKAIHAIRAARDRQADPLNLWRLSASALMLNGWLKAAPIGFGIGCFMWITSIGYSLKFRKRFSTDTHGEHELHYHLSWAGPASLRSYIDNVLAGFKSTPRQFLGAQVGGAIWGVLLILHLAVKLFHRGEIPKWWVKIIDTIDPLRMMQVGFVLIFTLPITAPHAKFNPLYWWLVGGWWIFMEVTKRTKKREVFWNSLGFWDVWPCQGPLRIPFSILMVSHEWVTHQTLLVVICSLGCCSFVAARSKRVAHQNIENHWDHGSVYEPCE